MTNEELLQVIERAAREKATKLDISSEKIRKLPPEIGKLTNLTELDISRNKLTVLPPEMGQLSELKKLKVRENKLSSLPHQIVKLSNLIKLDISGNQLSSLPPEIPQLSNLQVLDIGGNKLTSLPPEIMQLSNLKVLVLSRNKLTSLPGEIGKLINLTELYIRGNQLSSLPREIGELINLKELYLTGNQLRKLPPAIGKLSKLTYLYLTDNQLRSLPPEIGKLSELTWLNLSGNKLRSLPREISELSKLTKLYLRENKLSSFPHDMQGELKNLILLEVRDNIHLGRSREKDLHQAEGQQRVSPAFIAKLTPEQESLIPVYWEKWDRIAMCTDPIDRPLAADSVKAIYDIIGYQEPEIIFCDSLSQARGLTEQKSEQKLGIDIEWKLKNEIGKILLPLINMQIEFYLRHKTNLLLWPEVEMTLHDFHGHLRMLLFYPDAYLITAPVGVTDQVHLSYVDFCVEVLNCIHNQKVWEVYKSLGKNCGGILPYEKVCFVCDRPRALRFDNRLRLHAEGEPAIQFADGFRVYAHHGVRLPAAYGKLHPEHWRAEWLLSEENAEVRRVLIQSIGYDRICQELEATQLDTWQEYQLLRIDIKLERIPMYLLKMTCPSTGYIHAIRVPPNVRSARDAIKWVNWGIDPDEFSVQS